MLDLIHAYENYLIKVKQASNNTVASYIRDIRQYSEWLQNKEAVEVLNATQLNINRYLSYLQEQGKSGATVSRTLASLKNFYAYVVSSGFLDHSPVTSDIHVDRGEKKLPQILSGKEVELLLAQPSGSDAKGLRDKAMLEVMYATGIKVSEIISLNLNDINLQLGYIYCKGDSSQKHERTIFLYPAAVKCLKEYIENSRKFLSDEDEALFLNINGTRMTRQGFWKILKGYVDAAGIKKTITPHTLRHSFATHLLENGADINDIKEILGHSDIASTQVYTNYLKSKVKNSFHKFHPRA